MSIAPHKRIVDTTNWRDYALGVYRAGFNVVPMRTDSKAPALASWKEYTSHRQTEAEALALPWNSPNIGIINGINNIRTIDIDQCSNGDMLFNMLQLLGLDFEYQWVVASPGKGGGYHIYLQCPDALTLTTNSVLVGDPHQGQPFKQIELRWNNCVTMFPYSIHPETQEKYDWLFNTPQEPLATIPVKVIERAFLEVATPQKRTQAEKTNIQEKRPPKYDAWSQKALDQELSILRSTSQGQRNTQLNRSAFNLGQIIGAGLLNLNEVTDTLNRIAGTIGLNEKEAVTTIKSGIEAGRKKPRMPKQIYKENEPAFKLPPTRKIDDEKLASFTPDDQGHAEAVHWLYGKYLAYNDSYGWMIWNGTHFTPSVHRINTLIVEVLRHRQRAAAHMERADLAKISKAQAGTVSATRTMLESLCTIEVEDFDAEPDLINCLSGIVNLRTKTVIPHDPAYRFTWCAPVRYNPQANDNLWLQFINETVATPDMVSYLQQALGYSITGHTSEEVLFYIFGPPRSGKGTLSETILAIFPRPIAIEVDFNTFTAKREGDAQNFDLAPMKAARLVFASESNKYQSLNPAKVKALTGGNLVHCAFKHRDFFSYRPQYAVWLSSNHEINADADDDALWGRVKVIHFPHSRLGKEDKSLKRRMQTAENLEFVLAWLIDGAYQWYQLEEHGLQTPEAVRLLTEKQRNDQDSIGLWIEECCERNPQYWTENNKLRTSYENWCTANGYEPKKANSFGRSLGAHGLEPGIQRRVTLPNGSSENTRGVQGLRLSEN